MVRSQYEQWARLVSLSLADPGHCILWSWSNRVLQILCRSSGGSRRAPARLSKETCPHFSESLRGFVKLKKIKKSEKNSEVIGWVKPQLGFFFFWGNLVFFCVAFSLYMFPPKKIKKMDRGMGRWGLGFFFLTWLDPIPGSARCSQVSVTGPGPGGVRCKEYRAGTASTSTGFLQGLSGAPVML